MGYKCSDNSSFAPGDDFLASDLSSQLCWVLSYLLGGSSMVELDSAWLHPWLMRHPRVDYSVVSVCALDS